MSDSSCRAPRPLSGPFLRLFGGEASAEKEWVVFGPEGARFTLRARHARTQIENGATGASASMVNITHATVRELTIPLPPIDEQRAIVAHLRERTVALDAAADTARRAIELLREVTHVS